MPSYFKVREADIEAAFTTRMRALGKPHEDAPLFVVVKVNLMGFRGWPDRLIFGRRRFVQFIEFKRPGEKPTAHQGAIHRLLQRFGFVVLVIDSKEVARQAALDIYAGRQDA